MKSVEDFLKVHKGAQLLICDLVCLSVSSLGIYVRGGDDARLGLLLCDIVQRL